MKKLMDAVIEHYQKERENIAHYVERGYYPHWNKEHCTDSDKGLKQYSTPKKWEKYKSGTLPRADAVNLATVRAWREVDAYEKEKADAIIAAQDAPDVYEIIINVTWHRSRTWGYCPTVNAKIRTANGWSYYNGRAGGCGYDKESAAIAEALNASPSVLKLLYIKEIDALTAGRDRRDFIGYGSGYGILPYFEGGVGVYSHCRIFENCGYTFETVASDKMFTVYRIYKKEDGKQ